MPGWLCLVGSLGDGDGWCFPESGEAGPGCVPGEVLGCVPGVVCRADLDSLSFGCEGLLEGDWLASVDCCWAFGACGVVASAPFVLGRPPGWSLLAEPSCAGLLWGFGVLSAVSLDGSFELAGVGSGCAVSVLPWLTGASLFDAASFDGDCSLFVALVSEGEGDLPGGVGCPCSPVGVGAGAAGVLSPGEA